MGSFTIKTIAGSVITLCNPPYMPTWPRQACRSLRLIRLLGHAKTCVWRWKNDHWAINSKREISFDFQCPFEQKTAINTTEVMLTIIRLPAKNTILQVQQVPCLFLPSRKLLSNIFCLAQWNWAITNFSYTYECDNTKIKIWPSWE